VVTALSFDDWEKLRPQQCGHRVDTGTVRITSLLISSCEGHDRLATTRTSEVICSRQGQFRFIRHPLHYLSSWQNVVDHTCCLPGEGQQLAGGAPLDRREHLIPQWHRASVNGIIFTRSPTHEK
jgi:hypothetical protein